MLDNNLNSDNKFKISKKMLLLIVFLFAFVLIGSLLLGNKILNQNKDSKNNNEIKNSVNLFPTSNYECNAGDIKEIILNNISLTDLKSYLAVDNNIVSLNLNESVLILSCLNPGETDIQVNNNDNTSSTSHVKVLEKIQEVEEKKQEKETIIDKSPEPQQEIKENKEVEKDNSSISIAKESYSCIEGEIIDNILVTTSEPQAIGISKYYAMDSKIAKIEPGTLIPNCGSGCQTIKITCLKAGTTKVVVESTTGKTATATIEINKKEDSISIAKDNYTCTVGETIDNIMVSTSEPQAIGISKYYAMDAKIAKIEPGTLIPNCGSGCQTIKITCLKAGTTKVVVESTTGKTATANLKVK